MHLELRHLRVICTIAETGSVTKAASVLGLAQAALTAQLHRIEGSLGGQLFERDRRGARPTALGELVLARARVLLPAVQDLRADAARLASAETLIRYRIGAVNGPILGGLVHRLAAEQPEAGITTHPAWSAAELAGLVATGRLDFALIGVCGDAGPPAGKGSPGAQLEWRAIAADPVFVLLPDHHPLAGQPEVALAALAGEHWAATPGDGCFSDCFAAACVRAGFAPKPMYEADLGGVIDLVRAGEAVALCQPTFRQVPGLAAYPLSGNPLRWRHLLGWLPGSPAAGFAGRLARHAVAAYDEAAGRSARYREWLAGHSGFGTLVPL
ncbi:LysR family transcriptional regulator [Longispora albida]|uniref:LysR family transcriptional regulator n=1 Tax=Longispora albida TaxID=203523 RepID=UPI00036FCA28|nr:LysR family transcriptional regulator [Longispora albida]